MSKNPSKQVKKQVKNWKKINLSFCSPSDTFFEEPHSNCCYFLATPATYSAKMARKSKFHHIWLIFRKKGSGTSEMCTMGSFRMFPHQIRWKTNLWKVSRKSHLEYSHGLLNFQWDIKIYKYDPSITEIAKWVLLK